MSETRRKHAGADWIRRSLRAEPSPFGEVVADILGDVWCGIYHMDEKALDRVEWANSDCMSVIVYGELATWDDGRLTRLVVLCHDRCVRLAVQGCGPRYVRLVFTSRIRDGSMMEGHPTIEEAIQRMRGDA